MADDEEEEFEDAVEKFDKPNQLNKPASIPLPRAAVLHHGAISQGMSLNDNSKSSVRRDRLSALRNRMREEFGSRDNGTPSATRDDDSSSIISDATSLHSWHRRVLAGPDTVIVLPTDSVSTYAAPATGNNYPSLWSPVPSEKEAISPSIPESGVFRPPNRPPPPIPLRERGFSSPTDVSVPPPLPPRTPSYRLPDALSSSPHFSDNSAEKVWSPTQSSLQPQAQQVLTNSNESVTSSSDCLKQALHKKGHVKSNSLDRGLTLAKSLKAGPFPPPSNKSNSLTRAEEDGEEKERNTAAEGVIRLITTGLIPEKGFKTEPLDTIPSCSSSISTPSSQMSKKTQDVEDEQCIMHQIIVEESRETNSGENCESLEPARPVSSVFSPHPVIASSVDPITRDVERRMSMKRDGTLPDNLSDDGKSERFSTARNTVDQARNLARSYGTLASGILRGAIQKVKGSSSRASSSKVEEATSESDGEQSESGNVPSGTVTSIVRPRKTKKGPYDFENLTMVQEISNEHTGAVWCIRFSVCGRLIATAGQDAIIRVWAVKSHIKYFQEMRERYQQKTDGSTSDVFESTLNDMESFRPPSSADSQPMDSSFSDDNSEDIISGKPFALFKGHTADILDLSWSKNYFILSSGMDRTVKLWHISRNECLCCFQHVDFVTCVAFLPKDDRYFLSGSLDGKLRLWYIPDKKVAVWNEVQVKFITALTFVKNGKFAVVGTYNGRCYFYTSDQLKYHTVVDVRSSRGKNARGHKITGLAVHGDKLLVTSNDSRIRMYDVRDKALACKFRGAQNEHSQIRAAFSPDGKHIICGSEDKFIYLWRTSDLPSTLSVRKDRNAMWERVRSHAAPVSVAVFASKPQVFFSILDRFNSRKSVDRSTSGHVIISADLSGSIKVFVNRSKQEK